MDWCEFHRNSVSHPKLDAETLLQTATEALRGTADRPKLSSVHADLLLLQRSGGDIWILTSQLVAIAEELGLHLDCTSWDIPEWEKGLRRRLAAQSICKKNRAL